MVNKSKKILGKGNTAEVIEYEEGKVCKLFYKGYPHEYVELEYQNAKELYNKQVMVPKPFELVIMEERSGIIYERIGGKSLWKFFDETGDDRALETFVNLHSKILAHHSSNLVSYKDFLKVMVSSRTKENQSLLEQIDALPDGDCICHGDFHPDNVLIKSDGTAVVIDFMNVCCGPVLYDIARTFYLLNGSNALLADKYLMSMNVPEESIVPYISVIEKCREYEG